MNQVINYEVSAGKVTLANYEELKQYALSIKEKYANLVITEEDYASAKDVKADLNKIVENINNKRIAIEKAYMLPYRDAEAKLKEIAAIVTDAYVNLNEQVKQFDARTKQEKSNKLYQMVKTALIKADLRGIEPKLLIKKEWLNKTYTYVKIEEDIAVAIENIKTARYVINMSSDKSEMWYEYTMNGLNLEKAMMTVSERKKALANVKKEANENGDFTVTYEITGTADQLKELSNYLKEKGVKFNVK